jgi:hypothetical protein
MIPSTFDLDEEGFAGRTLHDFIWSRRFDLSKRGKGGHKHKAFKRKRKGEAPWPTFRRRAEAKGDEITMFILEGPGQDLFDKDDPSAQDDALFEDIFYPPFNANAFVGIPRPGCFKFRRGDHERLALSYMSRDRPNEIAPELFASMEPNPFSRNREANPLQNRLAMAGTCVKGAMFDIDIGLPAGTGFVDVMAIQSNGWSIAGCIHAAVVDCVADPLPGECEMTVASACGRSVKVDPKTKRIKKTDKSSYTLAFSKLHLNLPPANDPTLVSDHLLLRDTVIAALTRMFGPGVIYTHPTTGNRCLLSWDEIVDKAMMRMSQPDRVVNNDKHSKIDTPSCARDNADAARAIRDRMRSKTLARFHSIHERAPTAPEMDEIESVIKKRRFRCTCDLLAQNRVLRVFGRVDGEGRGVINPEEDDVVLGMYVNTEKGWATGREMKFPPSGGIDLTLDRLTPWSDRLDTATMTVRPPSPSPSLADEGGAASDASCLSRLSRSGMAGAPHTAPFQMSRNAQTGEWGWGEPKTDKGSLSASTFRSGSSSSHDKTARVDWALAKSVEADGTLADLVVEALRPHLQNPEKSDNEFLLHSLKIGSSRKISGMFKPNVCICLVNKNRMHRTHAHTSQKTFFTLTVAREEGRTQAVWTNVNDLHCHTDLGKDSDGHNRAVEPVVVKDAKITADLRKAIAEEWGEAGV